MRNNDLVEMMKRVNAISQPSEAESFNEIESPGPDMEISGIVTPRLD
jgi:hypothetical protein